MRQALSTILIIPVFWIFSTLIPSSLWGQEEYPRTYQAYMEMGRAAFDAQQYEAATEWYRHAHLVSPSSDEPLQYLQRIQQILGNHPVSGTSSPASVVGATGEILWRETGTSPLVSSSRRQIMDEALDRVDQHNRSLPSAVSQETREHGMVREEEAGASVTWDSGGGWRVPTVVAESVIVTPAITEKADSGYVDAVSPNQISSAKVTVPSLMVTPSVTFPVSASFLQSPHGPSPTEGEAMKEKPLLGRAKKALGGQGDLPSGEKKLTTSTKTVKIEEPNFFYDQRPVSLDDSLVATQPGTPLIIELNRAIILEGQNIDRFLAISPDIISVEKISRDQIRVVGVARGKTYFHVWDDQRRWTFNVEVILPVLKTSAQAVKDRQITGMKPLQYGYSIDATSYYQGPSFDAMERKTLEVLQWMGFMGETPFGYFDSGVTFNKFQESTEAIGYTVGLTKGHVGDFKDFTIRGFDTSKEFSGLTLPGRSFRGILLDAMAFDKKIAYSYIRGQDKVTYGYVRTGEEMLTKAYVEGFKATFFPKQENNFSVNYARSFGPARGSEEAKNVYSVEGQRRVGKIFYTGEVAHDEHVFAYTAGGFYKEGMDRAGLQLRDIDKSFKTVTGAPANRGEVGGIFNFNKNVNESILNGYVDLYRDNFLPNEDNPSSINLDANTSYEIPVKETDRWRTGLNYAYTPQQFSVRDDLRINSSYIKNIRLWTSRDLSWSVGGEAQRSRFPSSHSDDYDRFSLQTGIRVPLWKSFSYFWNYQYSLVDNLSLDKWGNPAVMSTGVDVAKRWTDTLSSTTSLTYRDEERADSVNSYLAGEDSVSAGLGLTYQPDPDIQIYVDTRARNVWAESQTATAYNDWDVRAGMRSAWNTPLVWNPEGVIKGVVFKDLNGNQVQDAGEPGIADVVVKVGKDEMSTWKGGRYQKHVRAKKVQVAVDLDTVPSGFVFTTPMSQDVEIIPFKTLAVNFGVVAQSGIYGTVFVDDNGNGRFDSGEKTIARAKVVLDEKEIVFSDFEGTYYFRNVPSGRHSLSIDINSLPMEYLPVVKLKNEVELAEGATYLFPVPLKASK